jgi:membrane protein YdbS with pleckstrin-like domain
MERFPSKRDAWLTGVMLAALGVSLISLIATLLAPRTDSSFGWVLAIWLSAALFVAWLWTTTDYTLGSGELLVRSGPFRWRVPLAEIQEIEPTRNPLSSPALSLDRLEIVYGKSRRLLISPREKDRFLRAVVEQAPQLELQGDRVRRRR